MTIDIDPTIDPMLQGHYEPVHDERVDRDLEVTGEIPSGLVGTYLRNGGNPAFPPLGKYHVFDGDGMIHGVTLDGDGHAHYRNRYVESRGLLAEREAGHALFGGLSNFSFPAPEVMEKAGMMKNTANTNIIRHQQRLLALMEAGTPIELADDLSTVGEFDFDGSLSGPFTAHPKFDTSTGEMLAFGYLPFPPYLRYHTVAPDGSLRSVDIDAGRATMMHDFVVTERHAVFFDLPALFDLDAMMSGGAGIRWDGDAGARIGVIPRDGGSDDIRWIDVEPFFVFHFLNGWDTPDGKIVVFGCRSPRMNVSFGEEAELPDDSVPTLHRWVIDPVAGTVSTEQLDDRPADFPRLNDDLAGVPNRYGYLGHTAAWDSNGEVAFDGVTRHDLESGTDVSYVYGPNVRAGEPVFCADPSGAAEDDGWIVNFVTDMSDRSTSFIVLDARDITAGPVCEVRIPRRVPFGFHGNWMPGLELG